MLLIDSSFGVLFFHFHFVALKSEDFSIFLFFNSQFELQNLKYLLKLLFETFTKLFHWQQNFVHIKIVFEIDEKKKQKKFLFFVAVHENEIYK